MGINGNQNHQSSLLTFKEVKQHDSYKRDENIHPIKKKLEKNAIIEKADKGNSIVI
jgi:hypothetical protein